MFLQIFFFFLREVYLFNFLFFFPIISLFLFEGFKMYRPQISDSIDIIISKAIDKQIDWPLCKLFCHLWQQLLTYIHFMYIFIVYSHFLQWWKIPYDIREFLKSFYI